jgi:hypothetical protein
VDRRGGIRSSESGPHHREGRVDAPDSSAIRRGYSITKPAGPLDLGMFGQVTMRKDWWAPAGGLEAGYSWIEGYAVTLEWAPLVPKRHSSNRSPWRRAGGDRLTVEYAVRFSKVAARPTW